MEPRVLWSLKVPEKAVVFFFCHKEVAALTSTLASLPPLLFGAHHYSRWASVWDEEGGWSPVLWQGSQVPP